jgi:hypothetical protein
LLPLFSRTLASAALLLAAASPAALAADTGGFRLPTPPKPTKLRPAAVPGDVAKLNRRGLARPPAGAPAAVKAAIYAGNKLQNKPYVYGGGHASFRSRGYDCSGTVSFVLHAAGLLDSPLASGGLARWGRRGAGRWISVYANGGHAYVVLAGLRLDTSGSGGRGPRWRPEPRSRRGFAARHPRGL